MSRHFDDWLSAFVEYAGFGEAPKRMYYWVGVSVVAGALRRRVWIDQKYFRWYPNFYIILVAPPGIVAKSTTADVGMSLLQRIPEIKFGPSVVTWQSLVKTFAECGEGVILDDGNYHPMACLTIVSSEFGNLLNPQDKDMVDMLVNLWDGKPFTKATKMSGVDSVVNPWLNIVACTTPEWIAGSFPEYMIGGGFTSRCVFVYADKKEKYVAYPGLEVPADLEQTADRLVADLGDIAANVKGEMRLTPEAIDWGKEWYTKHYGHDAKAFDQSRFGGYVARKQTHVHKLAMVVNASRNGGNVISAEDLQLAYLMVTDLEAEMAEVFARIGQREEAKHAGRLVQQILRAGGKMEYKDVFRFLQVHFPSGREAGEIIDMLIRSGQLQLMQVGATMYLRALEGVPPAAGEPKAASAETKDLASAYTPEPYPR